MNKLGFFSNFAADSGLLLFFLLQKTRDRNYFLLYFFFSISTPITTSTLIFKLLSLIESYQIFFLLNLYLEKILYKNEF